MMIKNVQFNQIFVGEKQQKTLMICLLFYRYRKSFTSLVQKVCEILTLFLSKTFIQFKLSLLKQIKKKSTGFVRPVWIIEDLNL